MGLVDHMAGLGGEQLQGGGRHFMIFGVCQQGFDLESVRFFNNDVRLAAVLLTLTSKRMNLKTLTPNPGKAPNVRFMASSTKEQHLPVRSSYTSLCRTVASSAGQPPAQSIRQGTPPDTNSDHKSRRDNDGYLGVVLHSCYPTWAGGRNTQASNFNTGMDVVLRFESRVRDKAQQIVLAVDRNS